MHPCACVRVPALAPRALQVHHVVGASPDAAVQWAWHLACWALPTPAALSV